MISRRLEDCALRFVGINKTQQGHTLWWRWAVCDFYSSRS
nr:MAG TPA: hypothetical protein [Caudoviricetes sp.]